MNTSTGIMAHGERVRSTVYSMAGRVTDVLRSEGAYWLLVIGDDGWRYAWRLLECEPADAVIGGVA